MTPQLTREATAEFIGTFMLVFVGAGAVAATSVFQPNVVVIAAAFAHALILASIISTYGHISGAHVNPAVTLGLLIGGKIELNKALIYMVAQIIGGILAALVLRIVLTDVGNAIQTLGQTAPNKGINELDIFVIEAILTFFLVSAVYQNAVYGRGGNLAALYIPFTLAACILIGGTLTGASLNPARTLGPALLAEDVQDFGEVLVYLAAIFTGGALAGIVHTDDAFVSEETLPAAKKKK